MRILTLLVLLAPLVGTDVLAQGIDIVIEGGRDAVIIAPGSLVADTYPGRAL